MSDTEDQKIPPSEWKVDSEGCLQLACQDLESLPSDLSSRFGSSAKTLDLSFNEISSLGSSLEGFSLLHTLVLDNNALSSSQPGLAAVSRTLRVLSVNNNSIDDLDAFLDSLTPLTALRQLSMLKNPACPSPCFGGDSEDYARHRLYVISRLPSLEFLDTAPVSQKEKAEALRRGSLLRVAKPLPPEEAPESAEHAEEEESDDSQLKGLSPDMAAPGSTGPARFGTCSYVYYGKQSEGNRFILNDDL